MLFPFVLLAVSIACYFTQIQRAEPPVMSFPDDLHTWCPYTKFCQQEPTDPIPPNSTDKYSPCCEPCSCSSDCGLTRNCCSAEFDRYKLDERLGTICKALSNKVHLDQADDYYYMVDKCENEPIDCKSKNVSVWGSYFPVYSRASGIIYYNKYCAECHNQRKIVEFLPSVTCSDTDGPFSRLFINILSEMGSDEIENGCVLQFWIPPSIDVSSQLCFPRKIDCDNRTALQPQYIDVCKSFNATFFSWSHPYYNVYCYLCLQLDVSSMEDWMEYHSMCPVTRSERFVGKSSLVVLLDKSSLDTYKASRTEPSDVREYCSIRGNSTHSKVCRPVYCPEGQFHVKGTCTLLGQTWYVQNVHLYVKLTPCSHAQTLTISDLQQVTDDQLASKNKAFIQRPKFQNWNMVLFYNVNETDTTIRYILAVLLLEANFVRPKLLLAEINEALREPWVMTLANNRFELRAEFNEHINYYQTEYDTRMHYQHGYSGYTLDDDKITNWSTGLTENEESYRLCITKLFFCEQVDLGSDEFIPYNNLIYLLDTKRYLGTGEFKVNNGTKSAMKVVRVCLSDLSPDKNDSNTPFGNFFDRLVVILLVLLNGHIHVQTP